jgi:hypothetical protein
MTPAEEAAGANVAGSPADQPPEDEPEEPRPSQPKLRWGHRSHRKASGPPLRLHEHAEMGESAPSPGGDDSDLIPGQPDEERWRHRASLSTVAGAVAVLIYMIVVTPALLTPTDGGNPFFLILGAIVLFFLAEMLVNGLADLALWMARWLGPAPARARDESRESIKAAPAAQTPSTGSVNAHTGNRATGGDGVR